MSFNIDSLRNAARRGDWLTFCLQPAMLTSFMVGVWLLFMGASSALSKVTIVFSIVVTVFLGVIVGIFLFMPWAALYTKIDLGADTDARHSSTAPAADGGRPDNP